MATRRKPAIERSSGIVDDIIVPVAKRALKGLRQQRTMQKIANQQFKKSSRAWDKLEKAVASNMGKSKNVGKSNITSPQIRRQYKKHYAASDVANRILDGKTTKGVARNAKKTAPKYHDVKNFVAPRKSAKRRNVK